MTTTGFWRDLKGNNQRVGLTGFGQINNTWYLFPDGNGPRGSFTSFATLAPNLKSRDTIILGGVLREQAVAPLGIYDVEIIGAANRPRQATSGGLPTGGGACWLPPASGAVATTPLLELRAAGWNISNVEFSPHTNSACIRLTRSAVVDTIDSSHSTFENCLFGANGIAGGIGIEDNGGASRVLIDQCRFEGLTTGVKGLNTAAAVPLGWIVRNNLFLRNTNAIGMSSSQGLFWRNIINQAANDANFKMNLVAVAGQGDLNQVLENYFSDVAANVTIAKGYKPGATDVWRNFVTDVAAYIVTVPA